MNILFLKKKAFTKLNCLIMVINIIIYVLIYNLYGITPRFIQMIFLTSILSVISAIDLKLNIIPNKLICLILIFGVIFNILNETITLGNMTAGFFIISLPLLIMSIVLKGSMGGGDIKLMAAAGAFLGWKHIVVAFFIASVIGSLISIILIISNKIKGKDMIPYGPFLSIGILIAGLYGNKLISWYIGI
ncbi:prepilin peptidase [Clostridium saccharoperbutylacetonicum]|uniref:prepilin peptidase n=1 Tax=Clostridium saccharoperbutylacetonicum TaxID=36745 RepID=UPI0039E77614